MMNSMEETCADNRRVEAKQLLLTVFFLLIGLPKAKLLTHLSTDTVELGYNEVGRTCINCPL